MRTTALAWRYLWSRPLSTWLNVTLLALGLGSMAFVFNLQDQIDRAFERDLGNIDVVVGAKGSPLQLILSAVFHVDTPTGNISLADVRMLNGHPQVASAIPVSVGDNVGGWRIVGTSQALAGMYDATLAEGRWWNAPMETVIGASVARQRLWTVGQGFVGSHGLSAGGALHDTTPYRIVGILAPCQCVLDRLVLTDTASVWQVHEEINAGDLSQLDDEDKEALAAEREVTALLIRYRTPMAAVSFPRWINTGTDLQAAMPAVEVNRLLSLVGVGASTVQGMGAVLVMVAALSVFIAMWSAVRERQTDLALLRMLGAPPRRLFGLVVAEGLWMGSLGAAMGLLLAHAALWGIGSIAQLDQRMAWNPLWWAGNEIWIAVLALLVPLVAASLPAIAAYRTRAAPLLGVTR